MSAEEQVEGRAVLDLREEIARRAGAGLQRYVRMGVGVLAVQLLEAEHEVRRRSDGHGFRAATGGRDEKQRDQEGCPDYPACNLHNIGGLRHLGGGEARLQAAAMDSFHDSRIAPWGLEPDRRALLGKANGSMTLPSDARRSEGGARDQ